MAKKVFYLKGQYSTAKNKKEEEFIEWLRENIEPIVIEGGVEVFERLVALLEDKAEELNRKYPRSKPILIGCIYGGYYVNIQISLSISLYGHYAKHIASLDENGVLEIKNTATD